jgi:hypothetical protein
MAWHARGQGFKSPQLHHHNTAGQPPCRVRPQHAASPSDADLGAHLGHGRQRHRQPLSDHLDHPGLHRLGHVPVARADHGALTLAPAAGLVAHQLVDHPGRDRSILQPSGEGVAQVMRAMRSSLGSSARATARLCGEVRTGRFSTVIVCRFDSDTRQVISSERVTPLCRADSRA